MNFTREEEYTIADNLIAKYKCRVVKNTKEPYTLFNLDDINDILEISNLKENIGFYKSHLITCIEQFLTEEEIASAEDVYASKVHVFCLTLAGLVYLLKRSNGKHNIEFAKIIGVSIDGMKFSCNNADFIDSIMKAFSGEEMIKQYKVNEYTVDLYFPKYNIVVESGDRTFDYDYDITRRYKIYVTLNECTFVEYHLDKRCFDIFWIINQIYKIIHEI